MTISTKAAAYPAGGHHEQTVALGLALIVYLLFTSNQTVVKLIFTTGVDPFLVSWSLLTVHVVAAAAFLGIRRRSWLAPLRSWPAHGMRGLFLLGSSFTGFASLQTLQIADMVAIAFMVPFVILVLARIFLHEEVSPSRWLVIALGFAGVLLIARPGTDTMQTGHLWAFSSVLIYSVYSILTKAQSGRQTPESMLVLAPLLAIVVLSPFLLLVQNWPQTPVIWSLLLLLGCCSAVAHACLVLAYRLTSASVLAPYGYTQMIWAVLAGYIVFGQLPDRWTVAGTTVIIASGLWLVMMDRRQLPVVTAHAAIEPTHDKEP